MPPEEALGNLHRDPSALAGVGHSLQHRLAAGQPFQRKCHPEITRTRTREGECSNPELSALPLTDPGRPSTRLFGGRRGAEVLLTLFEWSRARTSASAERWR